jgi:hypothetical protein
VIEILLQAERAMATGLVDHAERLYWQAVDADPRNSIAIVGLARVAIERADDRTAYVLGLRALAVDGENQAAQRLVDRLAEVMTYRGEALPGPPEGPLVAPARAGGAAPAAPGPVPSSAASADPLPGGGHPPTPDPTHDPTSDPTPGPAPGPAPARRSRRGGLFRRLLGRDG